MVCNRMRSYPDLSPVVNDRMKPPPFDQLKDADAFEELCHDLLVAEGFADVVWRGPGPDGGRDLEATWSVRDPTGSVLRTRWYVECKWYTESVPFAEIEPKLLAASAVRADYLLVVTSSRVRNTAMDSAHTWLASRGEPLRLRFWSGHDVLTLAVRHEAVFRKHFPSIPPPRWGTTSAELQRLTMLAASSNERLQWRVIPTLQAITRGLDVALSAGSSAQQYVAQLEMLGFQLRAQELLSLATRESASLAEVDVTSTVQLALESLKRRRLAATCEIVQLEQCSARTSQPLLATAVFELALNAVQNCKTCARVALTVQGGTHWALSIENDTVSALPVFRDWPTVGYRGPVAIARYPSGQGLGCWLAQRAASEAQVTLQWTVNGDVWTARIEGAAI